MLRCYIQKVSTDVEHTLKLQVHFWWRFCLMFSRNEGIYHTTDWKHPKQSSLQCLECWIVLKRRSSHSQIHGANMGPTWFLSAPDGPHVGTMNLAIGVSSSDATLLYVVHNSVASYFWNIFAYYKYRLLSITNVYVSICRNISHRKAAEGDIWLILWAPCNKDGLAHLGPLLVPQYRRLNIVGKWYMCTNW